RSSRKRACIWPGEQFIVESFPGPKRRSAVTCGRGRVQPCSEQQSMSIVTIVRDYNEFGGSGGGQKMTQPLIACKRLRFHLPDASDESLDLATRAILFHCDDQLWEDRVGATVFCGWGCSYLERHRYFGRPSSYSLCGETQQKIVGATKQ